MGALPQPADVLAHRPPFLFVDEVTALEPGVSARATWRLTGDEWFFAGHFPGRPTLPGVLMCEAIAQVGAIAVLTDERFAGKLPLFGGLDKARFRRQVGPGDELTLDVTLGRMSARAGKGSGRALLGDDVACECELLFVVVDADGSPTELTAGARITEPLWPPKPKLLEIVGPGSHSRGSPLTTSMPTSTTLVFAVGGIRRWCIDSKHRGRLERAGRAEGVAGDALGRGHRRSGLAEHGDHRVRLGGVVERRRRAVGVDLPDVARLETGVVEREPHARDRPGTARRGRGDVVGVGVARRPEDLAEDRRPARLGVLPLLQHEHRRALAHDEAVAVGVERPAHARRRQRGHVPEPGQRGRRWPPTRSLR